MPSVAGSAPQSGASCPVLGNPAPTSTPAISLLLVLFSSPQHHPPVTSSSRYTPFPLQSLARFWIDPSSIHSLILVTIVNHDQPFSQLSPPSPRDDMKALSLGSLLLFGLAGAQTDAASPVPCECPFPLGDAGWPADTLTACVVDCTDSLAKQLSPAERMQTLCHGVAGQRVSCLACLWRPALHPAPPCSLSGL